MRSASPGRVDLIVVAFAAAIDSPLDGFAVEHPDDRALFLDAVHMNAGGCTRMAPLCRSARNAGSSWDAVLRRAPRILRNPGERPGAAHGNVRKFIEEAVDSPEPPMQVGFRQRLVPSRHSTLDFEVNGLAMTRIPAPPPSFSRSPSLLL